VKTAVASHVLTAGFVADAAGGRLVAGDAAAAFETVSTDTRTIGPRALFIALRGERFDGHAFLAEALARGATGLLVSDAVPNRGTAAVIHVADTLAGLQRLAREIRRRSTARVVAITGSAGKTTTKEVTAAILAEQYRVFRNAGNLNNHIGLPLSLLELRHEVDVAVVEFGMNHAGEIRTLVGIAEPDIRVWTNVGDAHIGYFGSRAAVAAAKAEILESATARTVAVVNADDPLVMSHASGFGGRRITFGESGRADIRARRIMDHGLAGSTAEVETPAGPLQITARLPGRALMSNVLAAVAVAVELGVPSSAIETRVAAFQPLARRGAMKTTSGGTRIVDDSYNASPAAMRAMLSALAVTPSSGRRIAVLGEMLELGESARALHAECGRAAASARVDELVVVGGAAADGLADGAESGGLARSHIHRFADSAAAAPFVVQLVARDDLVLVKGSRGTRTDVIVDRLMEQG
jgi:UDP-N-acetylmuramoyl-tripeptide--D-alanyl-D-alanine ligase